MLVLGRGARLVLDVSATVGGGIGGRNIIGVVWHFVVVDMVREWGYCRWGSRRVITVAAASLITPGSRWIWWIFGGKKRRIKICYFKAVFPLFFLPFASSLQFLLDSALLVPPPALEPLPAFPPLPLVVMGMSICFHFSFLAFFFFLLPPLVLAPFVLAFSFRFSLLLLSSKCCELLESESCSGCSVVALGGVEVPRLLPLAFWEPPKVGQSEASEARGVCGGNSQEIEINE